MKLMGVSAFGFYIHWIHWILYSLFIQELDDCDKTFIKEVFAGCVRYKSLLDVVVRGFYNSDGQTAMRVDETHYRGQFLNNSMLNGTVGTHLAYKLNK